LLSRKRDANYQKAQSLIREIEGVVGERQLKILFKQIFGGRRIAVVGSAPNIIGKNRGAAIDSYDIVVRFNLMTPSGRENDLGTKTDVRFVGCTLLERHQDSFSKLEKNSILLTSQKNMEFIGKLDRIAMFYDSIYPRGVLQWIMDTYCSALPEQDQLTPPPRSGLVFVSMLLKYGNPAYVRLFGFSAKVDDAMTAINYKGEGNVKYDPSQYELNHCSPSRELKALLSLEHARVIDIEI
jgi:hypothetical protein